MIDASAVLAIKLGGEAAAAAHELQQQKENKGEGKKEDTREDRRGR